MLPSAQAQIAGERKRARWDQARLSLVLPIGVIVAVAIVCVVIAVLTSAQRADEVSLQPRTATDPAGHPRPRRARPAELDSVASTTRARRVYPCQLRSGMGGAARSMAADLLTPRRRGRSSTASIRSNTRSPHFAKITAAIDLRADLGASLDLLRGRLNALPSGVLPILDPPESRKARSAHRLDPALHRPARRRRGRRGRLRQRSRPGNDHAPIVFTVKYIDAAMLRDIGADLQLPDLRERCQQDATRPPTIASPTSPISRAIRSRASPGSRRCRAARSWRASRRSWSWRLPVLRCWSV